MDTVKLDTRTKHNKTSLVASHQGFFIPTQQDAAMHAAAKLSWPLCNVVPSLGPVSSLFVLCALLCVELRDTVLALTSDIGKKTVSVLALSFLLP